MKGLLLILIISAVLYQGQCDLPVHCLKRQIVGDWKLEMTGTLAKGEEKCPCGHDIPDKASTSFLAMEDNFQSKQDIQVNLEGNDEVYDSKNRNNKGTWTMIYDEGFEITLNNVKYFAFSKYVRTNSYSYQSECGKTLVGWWYNENTKEKGCYRAIKTSTDTGQKALTDNVKQAKVVQPKFLQLNLNQMEATENQDQDTLNLNKQFKEHQKVVDRLNSIQNKMWTAAVPSNFAELNIEQMNKHAGRRKYQFYTENSQKQKVLLPSFAQTSSEGGADNYQHFSRFDVSSLPKEYSWAQYLEPPIQQRDCGSCYVISTVEMLQSRLKIKHNDRTTLSIQNMLNCNYFNQGCDGGYPFLVEKYASEFTFLPESCGGSYQGGDGICNNKCSASDKKYKATNYRYLGGAYGKSNEKIMMEEIMNNGPIAVSFEPAYDFMYYSSGIYHSVDAESWVKNHEQQPNWEKVDHSVLLYGWGEEQGEKYWLVQNSWGDQWGEKGYFKIRRGTDESHIESMGEASDPVIINGSQQNHASYIEVKGITHQETSYKNSRNFDNIQN